MVIEALIQRRENIAADIRQLRENLAHIDAVIKMFEGETPAKLRKQRGEITRRLLDILREAKQPMTARDMASLLNVPVNNVGVALAQQRRKGNLKSSPGIGASLLWEIVK